MSKENTYTVGIDSGSTMCKAVLMGGKEIIDLYLEETTWNPAESAQRCFDKLIQRNHVSEYIICVATGYGRESVSFAADTLTEISAHAAGGVFLEPQIDGIIDIGGQDSKFIKIKNGKPISFQMNDKCAAGTGQFLKMACNRLGIPLERIDDFHTSSDPIAINSMCAVFAESEIIGLLGKQADRKQILKGILISIANKITNLAGKTGYLKEDTVLLTGGLSGSKAIVSTLQNALGCKVITNEKAQFAGAIGAAQKAYHGI